MRELGLYDFCFMSFFLQFARKRTRSGPCSPLASACLEHSIDSGLCTTGAAFAFGAGFAGGGVAAGGVAGGEVCPNATLAHALRTTAIINVFISAPLMLRGRDALCTSLAAVATPIKIGVCYTSSMATKITLEQKIDALTTIVEKGFAAVADDISRVATKEQLAGLQTQVNSIEQQLRETKTEVRLGALEEKAFGAPRR